jgi:predicted phosphodiesterase
MGWLKHYSQAFKFMKTLVLGDTHGRPFWKRIVEKEKDFDRIIFIGDYFDSREYTPVEQIDNFQEIIQYKKSGTRAEVILLIGNHDYHYFKAIGNQNTSGYQRDAAAEIEKVIEENKEQLQMAFKMDNFLFTHAGVSKVFMDISFGKENWKTVNIADDLNKLFHIRPKAFMFNGVEPSGDDVYQTPIWIRVESLLVANKGTLEHELIQVFGHTKFHTISTVGKITKGRYQLIDCLGTSGEYMIIENGSIFYRKYQD